MLSVESLLKLVQEKEEFTMEFTLNQITPARLIENFHDSKRFRIPVMAGYSFAYKMVKHYAEQEKIARYRDLFQADPHELFNSYLIKEAI